MSKPWWAGRMWAMAPQPLSAMLAWDGAGESERGPVDRPYRMDGSTAVIPVSGPLMRRLGFWGWLFGGSSYEHIAAMVRMADGDSAVNDIRLEIDSPGGEVNGVKDAVEALRGATKPIVARAVGDCCSAAYWLASQAGRIEAEETAQIGSIGVQATVWDPERPDEFSFVAAASPQKNAGPRTDEGKAQIQQLVDDLCDVFLADVAAGRGITADQVAARYGAGAVVAANRALEMGLIDSLTTTTSAGAARREEQQPMTTKGRQKRARSTANAGAATEETEAMEPGEEMEDGEAPDELEQLRQENEELRQKLLKYEGEESAAEDGEEMDDEEEEDAGEMAAAAAARAKLRASERRFAALERQMKALQAERDEERKQLALDDLVRGGAEPARLEALSTIYDIAHAPGATAAHKALWADEEKRYAAGAGVPMGRVTHGHRERAPAAPTAADVTAAANRLVAAGKYTNFAAAVDAIEAGREQVQAEGGR